MNKTNCLLLLVSFIVIIANFISFTNAITTTTIANKLAHRHHHHHHHRSAADVKLDAELAKFGFVDDATTTTADDDDDDALSSSDEAEDANDINTKAETKHKTHNLLKIDWSDPCLQPNNPINKPVFSSNDCKKLVSEAATCELPSYISTMSSSFPCIPGAYTGDSDGGSDDVNDKLVDIINNRTYNYFDVGHRVECLLATKTPTRLSCAVKYLKALANRNVMINGKPWRYHYQESVKNLLDEYFPLRDDAGISAADKTMIGAWFGKIANTFLNDDPRLDLRDPSVGNNVSLLKALNLARMQILCGAGCNAQRDGVLKHVRNNLQPRKIATTTTGTFYLGDAARQKKAYGYTVASIIYLGRILDLYESSFTAAEKTLICKLVIDLNRNGVAYYKERTGYTQIGTNKKASTPNACK